MDRRVLRLVLFAFALTAVSALAVGPICDAHLAQPIDPTQTIVSSEAGDFCCSIVVTRALPAAAQVVQASPHAVATPAVGSPVLRPAFALYAVPLAPPPFVLPFHSRSARILS